MSTPGDEVNARGERQGGLAAWLRGRFGGWPRLASTNALDHYMHAGSLISAEDREALVNIATRPTDDKRGIVARNRRALKALRAGLAFPCRVPPVTEFDAPMPWLDTSRRLAHLLCAESAVRRASGDPAGAMAALLEVVHLGLDQSRGGVMLALVVTSRLVRMAFEQGWPLIRELNALEARLAARRLSALLASEVPLEDIIRQESLYGFEAIRHCSEHRAKFRWMVEIDMGKLPLTDEEFWQRYEPILAESRAEYAAMIDAILASLCLPYTRRTPLPPSPNELVAHELPIFEESIFASHFMQAQSRLFLTALALRAHKAEQRTFPRTLQALCPYYLDAVQTDPFSDGDPLRYTSYGTAYLLYSLGPDGRDDGGAPVFTPNAAEVVDRYAVRPDSTGDIVAGQNTRAYLPRTAAQVQKVLDAGSPPA